MERETARTLVRLARNRGYEFTLHEDYSGRGMYGNTVTGIDVDSYLEFSRFLFEAAEDIAKEQDNHDLPYDLGSLSIDNMGRGYILY